MMIRIILCFSIIIMLAASVFGADLYEVRIKHELDAELLNTSGSIPVVRLPGGYLILAESRAAADLIAHGITVDKIAADITREELAADLRHDRVNIGRYPLLYEMDDFRLYRIDPLVSSASLASASLMRVREDTGRLEFFRPQPAKSLNSVRVDGLQELIDLVSQDSLTAYTERLQAFNGRVTGTDSNYAAALWIAEKFTDFGYDSVVVDSFVAYDYECQNVIAYKLGKRLPEHYIVVGAHHDAVEESPGADDNGTGTAAVMEMARVVKNIDTDLTLVFILFDGEEVGFFGSSHYAGEAYHRGDSIIFMMNLDMIANYTNSDQAKLYDCYDNTISLIWQTLADSLAGISGVLAGYSGSSDHFPFYQYGYLVTCVHEYILSDVLHTPHDSTTYLNFEYMTRMTQASLATIYWSAQSYIPPPSLAFHYPNGIPTALVSEQTSTFEVIVDTLYDGVPIPASGKIHYLINDDVVHTEAMTILSENHYAAELPALYCGDSLRFYVSAEEATEGIVYDPDPSEPNRAFPSTGDTIVFFDDFESDRGWMAWGDLWERGTPTGGGGEAGGPDPLGGYNSSSVLGYNLAGDYTDNMTLRGVLSQPMDFSGLMGVKLSFYRWLGVDSPEDDHTSVGVSRTGIYWTTIWENTEEVADEDWMYQEFDISSIADNQPVIYIRFTIGPTDDRIAYCGWNIDDFTITAFMCEQEPEPLEITIDSLPDWTAGCQFYEQLTATGGFGLHSWLDKFDELDGTGLTLSTAGLLSGVPLTYGDISFTAEVTDENNSSDEKSFAFAVGDSLKITTVNLASVIVGDPYNMQLVSSGGTDSKTWIDRDDDLVLTGLTISPTGLLSGTPVSTGLIEFIVRVGDGIGCSDDKPLSVMVFSPYVCGDANGDFAIDVGDAVYLISYIFKGGPPPDPLCAADANHDGGTNVADAVYLINYVFKGGPPPVDDCC